MSYLTMDIGGTFTKYAVMSEEGVFYQRGKVRTVGDKEEHFLGMLLEIYHRHRYGVEGIAISSAGIIDSEAGLMHTGGVISCIADVPVAQILERECGVPVTVENDAKCAALAEVWRGSLKGCRNAAVILCGTAIGGAVICDGKLVRGSHRLAGEFSYIMTDAKDPFNKQNSFAMQCGVGALTRLVAEKKGIPAEQLSGERIFAAANSGDEETRECVRLYARRLAVQIMNLQFTFDPERVAIGGGISAQPLLLELIRAELENMCQVYRGICPDLPLPQITTCRFFNDSNLVGALYVHLQKREKPEQNRDICAIAESI